MSENTALWDRVCKTDPKHVKPITGKQYSGNSPKPYYIVRRLTEEFGPCGKGWGFDIISERMERMSETDILHIACIEFWYGSEGAKFQQMGQTKAAYVTSKGALLVDEDAPKKSVTDALVKCASYLGFAGDIFMGMWDDSKYVAELKKEFADAPKQVGEPGAITGVKAAAMAASGGIEAVDDAPRVIQLAEDIKANIGKIGAAKIARFIAEEELDDTQTIFLSTLLPSNINNAIKKAQAAIREEATT